ncbi:uncharacterized protein LOC130654347 [Hydractinia symbiolongicarpus]|uniref:uncharacterized protein LOC130654347 n=1 Tax=Hydractinia symbiolongicarpus TaxID=13093 RepID=UPI00254C9F2C|nr:uncharacterized protein LOC130654347 [Hydractinia symbiolongicarpus]
MMQRVFRGLIHAKKCRGKKCDLLLCKNIKSVLLHTHQCGRADKCKTKRFIIQLCEHHQQMCCNKNCEVEFCQEIARKKKEDEIHRMFLINKKEKQLEQESTVRNLQSEESGQRNISIIPSMQSSSFITGLQPNFAPWPPGFGPLPGGQFFFPNVPLPCPYGMENQINQICTESDNSQMAQPAHYSFPQLQGNSVGDRTKIYNSEMSDEISQLPPSQPDDLYTELEPERSAKVEESSISPTEEMYYQLLREKERGTKSVLPSLSPNDLQTILMARGEGAQILSPVTDNRANYSEVLSFSQQDNSPHSSQESELEENPIPTNNYESTKPLSNTFLPSKKVDSIYNQQQLQARHEGSDRFKTEAEWSKIDFVKQQMLQEELDVETETADETDSDGISKPDYYDDEFSQSIPAHKHIEQSTITSIERNFLNIIKGQKLK